MLGLFGKTLTADHMNSPLSKDESLQQVQTPLSPKGKLFRQNPLEFFKSTSNFAPFERKDQFHSSNILEVIESKKCGYLNARRLLFQNTLWESRCPRLPNNDQIWTAKLLS